MISTVLRRLSILCILLTIGIVSAVELPLASASSTVSSSASAHHRDIDVGLWFQAQLATIDCRRLKGTASDNCRELVSRRLTNYTRYGQSPASKELSAAARAKTQTAIAESRQLAARLKTATRAVCRVRTLGRIDCASLPSILSYYDVQMGQAILSDIGLLYDRLEMRTTDDVLVDCGASRWTTVRLPAASRGNISIAAVSDAASMAQQITSACSDQLKRDAIIGSGAAFPPHGGSGLPGFTGITGFDNLGMSSPCGTSLQPVDEIAAIQASADAWRSFGENCTAGVAGTMMTGDSAEDTAPPPAPAKDATKEGETTTTTTNDDGSTSTTTTKYYSDNTVEKTTTTTDSSGNTMETTTQVGRVDDQGNIEYKSVTVDGSGNVTNVTTGSTSRTANGDQVGTFSETGPDGVTTNYLMVRTPDGTIYVPRGTKAEAKPAHFPDDYVDMSKFLKNCTDPTCQNCGSFASVMPGVLDSCLGAAGGSFNCQQTSRFMQCCQSSQGAGTAPMTVPKPDGDLVCIPGDAGAKAQQDWCQKKCSIATSEDCTAHCLAGPATGGLGLDMMDIICRMAFSEDCFSMDGSFVWPGPPTHGSGSGGPQPRPVSPSYLDSHWLYPSTGDKPLGGPRP